MQFFASQSKSIKRLMLFASSAILILLVSLLQSNILSVKADVVVLIVSDTALPFGTVFPGQVLTKTYTVLLDTSAPTSSYTTILEPVGGFLDLCPHVQLSNIDNPLETDTLLVSTLQRPTDIIDTWEVKLDTPGILGQVSQNHSGGIVVTSGNFACKITVTTDLSAGAVTDLGGCQGTDCGSVQSNSLGSGGGSSGGGGGPSGNPSKSSNGTVAGATTNIPSDPGNNNDGISGVNGNPIGQVLGATELPRTGAPLWEILASLFVAAILVSKKFRFI